MFGLTAASRCCSGTICSSRVLAITPSFSGIRQCSTAPASTNAHPSTAPRERMMPFADYVKYKKRLRNRQLVWALPCGVMGTMTSAAVVSSYIPNLMAPPEEIEPIMGMDPLIFYGFLGAVNGFIAAGLGYTVFGQLWHLANSQLSTQLLQRDNDFKLRIAKHRFEGDSRFEDDYYGDKVRTLSDYRQWIRTQQQKKANMEKLLREEAAAEK